MLKNKKIRNWGIAILVAIVIVALLPRVILPARASGLAQVAGTVTSVNVAETVDASGTLEAQPFASLTWNTSGVVDQVYVKAGDKVKAGDVLMKLNASSVSSDVISAQTDLANAQKDLEDLLISSDQNLAQATIDLKDAKEAYDKAANYLKYLQTSQKVRQTETKIFIEETFGRWRTRYKTRVFKGPAPADWITDAKNDLALKKGQLEDAQRAYDRLQAGPNAQDVAIAQTKVDAARATVDSLNIIAPFDGQVLYVESQPNDVVTRESTALDMANLDQLYLEAQVDESNIGNVKVGDPITATLDSVPGLELTGKVAALDPLGEEVSGSVQYTVRIDLNKVKDEVSLPLGSTANVIIQVKPAAPSLAVPITAIQNDSKGEYVSVIQPNGSTKRVDVVSGSIVGDVVVVTGNLKEGDQLARAQNNSFGPGGPFGGRN